MTMPERRQDAAGLVGADRPDGDPQRLRSCPGPRRIARSLRPRLPRRESRSAAASAGGGRQRGWPSGLRARSSASARSLSIRPSRSRTIRARPARDVVLVGDQDDRLAAGVELVEDLHDLLAGPGVEVAGRLVGEDDRRAVDQGAGDGDALALSARELVRLVPHAVREPDLLDRLLGELPAPGRGIPA